MQWGLLLVKSCRLLAEILQQQSFCRCMKAANPFPAPLGPPPLGCPASKVLRQAQWGLQVFVAECCTIGAIGRVDGHKTRAEIGGPALGKGFSS